MTDLWKITEDSFDLQKQHHKETIYTTGNGYICTRGALEEGYPGDRRASFAHGVFDAVPISVTELANAPDWLPLTILLEGERFSLTSGKITSFTRVLDLHTGVLSRTVEWVSPSGKAATISFDRFISLADEHVALIHCTVTPKFEGAVEFRVALNGCTDNEGIAHWSWVSQGRRGDTVFLLNRTRKSGIDYASAMRLVGVEGSQLGSGYWDVENVPTLNLQMAASPGKKVVVDKYVAFASSRDTADPVSMAVEHANAIVSWQAAYVANAITWEREWERSDVVIEGDDEAQISMRFSLFQILIAAPRHDNRVNIGAKTLSGFGYRGHSFWDTEIFMLQFFIYTAPHIAKNLLNYRYQRLPAARAKAKGNGYEGAQFPWESADTGEEVTPTWIPHFADRNKLVRIWTGDIEIHISADVSFAAHKYWQITGDDDWLVDQGAELILDTAKFWASRAEWNQRLNRYDYNDVIGPDENHEHMNNNAYTNCMAQWNIQLALHILDWLNIHAPQKASELTKRLDLSAERLAHWRDVIAKIYINVDASGLIEQFEGFYKQSYVDLAALEPRTRSVQEIYGIQEASNIQVLKQPDVLMMQYLLNEAYPLEQVRVNYDYYTPRTDHSYGSSLGPSIQAIMACEVGKPDDPYEHFIRAARADLRDVRGNAGDGIHAASAAGTWQAVVFGFAGLRIQPATSGAKTPGWTFTPRLPKGWKRVAFKFFLRGQEQTVDIQV